MLLEDGGGSPGCVAPTERGTPEEQYSETHNVHTVTQLLAAGGESRVFFLRGPRITLVFLV